jgi:signal transduction histidine kinase
VDRILLVDDHPPNLTVLEACLGPLRCEILRSSGGREALDIFFRERIDIVLLDLLMPDLDGIAVLRRIRACRDRPYVPVVLVTARSEREDRLRGLEAGADEFLEKPLDRAILIARVRALLRAKQTQEMLAARERALQTADLERTGLRRDVSELREAQVVLRRSVRAHHDFISLASHELKTPLTSLRLNLDALRRHRLEENSAALVSDWTRAKIEALDRGVRRLESLVTHLLDASRIEAAGVSPEPQRIDLGDVVADSVKRFGEALALSGCELRLAVDDPLVGRWDPVCVTSVVDNLLSNAIKYGAGRPIEVAAAQTSTGVRLSVRDEGIGIAREDQERIFGQFERAVPDGHYGGFGLGLWIARTTVEAMGGSIWVVSHLTEGSTFHVDLPVERPALSPATSGRTGAGVDSPT